MEGKAILERAWSAITENNRRIALALSLQHNKPNAEGKTRIEQEKDRLHRIGRNLWERTKNPLMVGNRVSIPAETPVGVGPLAESYITEKSLQGTLTNVSGFYGQDGNELIEPLFQVSIEIPQVEEQPSKTAILLVPNDLLTKVIPEGLPIILQLLNNP